MWWASQSPLGSHGSSGRALQRLLRAVGDPLRETLSPDQRRTLRHPSALVFPPVTQTYCATIILIITTLCQARGHVVDTTWAQSHVPHTGRPRSGVLGSDVVEPGALRYNLGRAISLCVFKNPRKFSTLQNSLALDTPC